MELVGDEEGSDKTNYILRRYFDPTSICRSSIPGGRERYLSDEWLACIEAYRDAVTLFIQNVNLSLLCCVGRRDNNQAIFEYIRPYSSYFARI